MVKKRERKKEGAQDDGFADDTNTKAGTARVVTPSDGQLESINCILSEGAAISRCTWCWMLLVIATLSSATCLLFMFSFG